MMPDLRSPDPAVRRQAIERLDAADPQALIELHQLAVHDPDPKVRELALRTLLGARPEMAADEALRSAATQLTGLPPDEAVASLARPPAPRAAAARTDEPVYEMLWDCQYCGTQKLLGKTHRHCPNCGGQQNPEWRYFPSDEEKIAVADHVYHGADRVCPACKTPNGAQAAHCGQCGSPLDGAKSAARREDQVRAEGSAFASETVTDARREHAARKAGAAAPPRPRGSGAGKWIFLGVAALVTFLLVSLFWKKDGAVIATGHRWEREVRIETFGPQSRSDWCDAMPGDAYHVSHTREVRSTRRVPDGQDCSVRRVDNGDGTYKEKRECRTRYREEPVYDDRCRYTVDRWAYSRSVTARGQSLGDTPRWPEVQLRSGRCFGCEREGGRRETYTAEFTGAQDQKVHRCEFDQARWSSIPLQSKWTARIGVITGAMECDSLKPR